MLGRGATNQSAARGQSGPQGVSSYHVHIVFGREGKQLHLRGRSGRNRFVRRNKTSSVDQAEGRNRTLCYHDDNNFVYR